MSNFRPWFMVWLLFVLALFSDLACAACPAGTVTANSVYLRYYVESTAFDFLLRGDCILHVHHKRDRYACVTAKPKYGEPVQGWVRTRYIGNLGVNEGGKCPYEDELTSGSTDHRPRQFPCIVADRAGLDWRLGPSDDAPIRIENPPAHFDQGHIFGWESRPGPGYEKRPHVNGYIWVTREFYSNRKPTARSWVKADKLLCGNPDQFL